MDLDEDLHKLAETSATPESLVIEHSGIDAVRSAIEQLPPIYREVILLCDVKDKSYRQIAEILSIPIGTVMSRLARARKAVRQCLCSDPGPPQSRDLSHYIEAREKDRYPNWASSCWLPVSGHGDSKIAVMN